MTHEPSAAESTLGHIGISPVYRNRSRPVSECLASELLSLAYTSDVSDPNPVQFDRAQRALQLRADALAAGWDGGPPGPEAAHAYLAVCREIVDEHLHARAVRFGAEQCAPFEEAPTLGVESRDIFLVIKFMDEEPHIRSTIDSLLTQKHVDLSRVVLVGVDNMSSDRSGEIFREARDTNLSPVRMIYCRQPVSGGGNAARLGVDRCIATVRAMAEMRGDWSLLHRARIAVSDGDTIYHPDLVADGTRVFDTHHDVDGVMPFLTYKLAACLRLFDGWRQRDPAPLLVAAAHRAGDFVRLDLPLDTILAYERFPRARRRGGRTGVDLGFTSGESLHTPYVGSTETGERFGVLVDPDGNRALAFEDRFLVLERAPVAGYDSVLVHLENGRVRPDEIWRWHSLIGHDLFLLWSFSAMGLSRDFILPDTSDALKAFRVWAFSVGGQHQLRRPETERVTGTDYQSGRVLQCFGARTVLGSPWAYSETEIDRLAKMIRNFANAQSVFYGNTRAGALERASGLYLHMTRIQDKVEAEIRGYSEALYEGVVFPERLLFPLRWMLQNFICAYCVAGAHERALVAAGSFELLFDEGAWAAIRADILTNAELDAMKALGFEALRARGEHLAEAVIRAYWEALIAFYGRTLRQFFHDHGIGDSVYGFLLEPLPSCRNSLLEERPSVDVNDVWSTNDFVVDRERGQVIDIGAGNTTA